MMHCKQSSLDVWRNRFVAMTGAKTTKEMALQKFEMTIISLKLRLCGSAYLNIGAYDPQMKGTDKRTIHRIYLFSRND